MSTLDQIKVNEFIERMNVKSDEEILNILSIRHDYQPEASEAAIKIAMNRNLVDNELNEIKPDVKDEDNESLEKEIWFFESKGKRNGPITHTALVNLYENNTIDRDTLIWKRGYENWTPLYQSELKEIISSDEPPPLTGDKINNTFIWILAFAPIIGTIIEGELIPNGSLIFWFALNSILAVLDDFKLKNAGIKTNNLVWAILVVPVYIWRRTTITKQQRSYFWVWILSFIISTLLVNYHYYQNNSLFYIPSQSKHISTVKQGFLNAYPNKTVEEAVNSFFKNPKWKSIIGRDGHSYVNVEGKMMYFDKEVNALLQFKVNKNNNTFEINAFEINGVPQNAIMLNTLIHKMYNE